MVCKQVPGINIKYYILILLSLRSEWLTCAAGASSSCRHAADGQLCDVARSSHTARVMINPVRSPILLVVSRTGKLIFPCPRSRLRIWSLERETGSAVPSRVSLLISILRLNQSGAYLRDSSRVPWRCPFIYLNRHTPSGQS